jgi:hypothetical protein
LSVYREGNEAYLISSRHTKTVKPPLNRFFGIYKLTPDFLNIETELLWENFAHREAPWIIKKNGMYYMTYSVTRGWKPSHCYFKTAATLSGPWSEERQIKMIPERTERIAKSHSSQHRYIRLFGDQWVFGGDRYPVQEPNWYDAEKGRHIMCPVIWENDVPVVIWKEEWELKLPGDVAGK